MIIFFVTMIISISDSLRNPKSPIPTQPKPTHHSVPTSTYFSNNEMDDTFGRWRVVVSCNISRERERERDPKRIFCLFLSLLAMAQQHQSNGGMNRSQDTSTDNARKNKIQVSNTKKPLFFYVNLAKRFMQQYEEVELSALGVAISTVVNVMEILKNNGLVIVKKIYTSTIDIGDEMRGRMVQKPKMEITLKKSYNFDQ